MYAFEKLMFYSWHSRKSTERILQNKSFISVSGWSGLFLNLRIYCKITLSKLQYMQYSLFLGTYTGVRRMHRNLVFLGNFNES